jgi:hypothetical protein
MNAHNPPIIDRTGITLLFSKISKRSPARLKLSILLSGILVSASLRAAPIIKQQPPPGTNSVSTGAVLTFRVTASSTNGPLRYQWRQDAVDLPNATNATFALTNIQLTASGNYFVRVRDAEESVEGGPWTVEIDPTFTKITTGPVATALCSAAAWGDFNNDGFPDLYLTVSGGPNVLCINNGDGTFRKAASSAVTSAPGITFGCAWADFDNDGRLDLLRGYYDGNDQLFRNNGDGTFTQIKSPALPSSGTGANNVVWSDYDRDGFVDIFAANGFGSTRNTLFRNLGGESFLKITNNVLNPTGVQCLGASWADYDNDGFPDLVATRNGSKNLLFHNDRNGGFTAITNIISMDPVVVGAFAGPSWGDYDNDGFLDLFIAGIGGQHSALYHNEGNGSFTKITNSPINVPAANSTGGAWADYDNDGHLDLYVANQQGQAGFLYRNTGDGMFTKVTTGSPSNEPAEGQGAAWADYDNDGFPDLLVPNIRNGVKTFLYHNNGNSNHWLVVRCEGRVSNRAAIGARVRVQAMIGGRLIWQTREISGGGSLGSQNDLRCLFGLGDAGAATEVRVEWPSGITQIFKTITSKQILTIVEPSSLQASHLADGLGVRLNLRAAPGIAYRIQSSDDLHRWMDGEVLTNVSGLISFEQPGSRDPRRFFRAVEIE